MISIDDLIVERHPPRSELLQARGQDSGSFGSRARNFALPLVDQQLYRKGLVAIMRAIHPETRWAVPGLVPEGLSILAGRQKLGKSWLALDLALAVGTGSAALGSIPCDAGDVLLIDMENGEKRIQQRVRKLRPDENDWSCVERISVATESPMLGPDFVKALDQWRMEVETPKLVIVDVLQRIKPVGAKSRNAYENDYAALSSLQRWATTHGIAVLLIHHTRKGGADDPLEALSGSNGLSACADSTMVLDRKANATTLYVRGRDVPEAEHAMLFTDGLWTVTGNAAEVQRSTSRNALLQALEDAREPMSPTELAAVTGMTANHVRQLAFRLKSAGEIVSVGKGRYTHPRYAGTSSDHRDGPSVSHDTARNVTENPQGSVTNDEPCNAPCDVPSDDRRTVTLAPCNAVSATSDAQTGRFEPAFGSEAARYSLHGHQGGVTRNAVTRPGGRDG